MSEKINKKRDSSVKQKTEISDYDVAFNDYVSVLEEILRSRMCLRKIVEIRLNNDRALHGNLTAKEIHDIVKSQGEEDDIDFVTMIEEKKRQLLNEVRKNANLQKECDTQERRIGLLIRNAGSLTEKKKKKKKNSNMVIVQKDSITNERLTLYSNLFYLLQSEPTYLARLINCLTDQETSVKIIDSIILTIYGNAISSREEYLILQLMKQAMELEMSTLTDLWMSIQNQSNFPKMIVSYNKRKMGKEFLVEVLTNPLQKMVRDFPAHRKLNLEGKKILFEIINEKETTTGVEVNKRDLTDQEILNDEDVKAVINTRIKDLKEAAGILFEAIIASLHKIPYGLRYICKVLCDCTLQAYPNTSEAELMKYTSYFIFYRFIGTFICDPQNRCVDLTDMNNVLAVHKVLHQLFNLSQFSSSQEQTKWYVPMNGWIEERTEEVKNFLREVVNVEPPEDKLQIDKYMAMVADVRPTILINPHEITEFHQVAKQYLPKIAPDSDNPLNKILTELGDPEEYNDDNVITLVLSPKYISTTLEDENVALYKKTKVMMISVFKVITENEGLNSLMDVLDKGEEAAKSSNKETVLENIKEIRKNIKVLEKAELITHEDGYKQLLKDVALELTNRAKIREEQAKELNRLEITLSSTIKKQKELTELTASYTDYAREVMQRQFQSKSKKKKKTAEGKLFKPKEFSYNQLVKQGCIISSDIPKALRKITKFILSSEEVGVFTVNVVIPKVVNESVELKLEELLDMRSENQQSFRINDQVELNVNITIYVLNHLATK
ncbi:GTPase-activating protein [Entamoeba marina]